MAIRVQYNVPVATGGQIAYGAGRGLFEQERDKYLEGQRQFDVQQAGVEGRFARELDYKQELALLQNRQREDALAQQAYQFDASQQSSAYQREMDRRNRLQTMGLGELFQRGREDRADTRAIAGEERQDERMISSEARQQQRRDAEKQWLTANKDAELILKKNLRPEQLEQVAKQWEQRNGRDFPYQGAMQERMGESEGVVMARGILEGTDVMTEGMAAAFEGLPPEVAIEKAFGLRSESLAEQKSIRENDTRIMAAENTRLRNLQAEAKDRATAAFNTLKHEQEIEQKKLDREITIQTKLADIRAKLASGIDIEETNEGVLTRKRPPTKEELDGYMKDFEEALRITIPGQEVLPRATSKQDLINQGVEIGDDYIAPDGSIRTRRQ